MWKVLRHRQEAEIPKINQRRNQETGQLQKSVPMPIGSEPQASSEGFLSFQQNILM